MNSTIEVFPIINGVDYKSNPDVRIVSMD